MHLLSLCPDLSVHDGCRGDAARGRIDSEKATHGGRGDGIGHLTIGTLIRVTS